MVIDASVAFKWIVEEPDSDKARDLIGRADLIAPVLVYSEVGNALFKRVNSGELAPSLSLREQIADLAEVLITMDERHVAPRAYELAVELKHPIYDCMYLALADALGDKLLTADYKFVTRLKSHPLSRIVQLL